jgi:VIT1/CCC1 family predicted Fe2+/Mn2+ transporter
MSEKLYPLALAILAVIATLALHVIVGLVAGIPFAIMPEVLVVTGLIGMLLAGTVGFVLGRQND